MISRAPTVRSAESSDAAAVARIYAPYVQETPVSFETDPPSAAAMAGRISGTIETHPWLVAERDGHIVGYAYAGKHSQRPAYRWTADVTVYVDGKVRRSGVGRALYFVLLGTLRRQGFRSAFAEIVLPNPDSIRLHEETGFRPIGVHQDIGFKLGRWHDIGYWRLGLSVDATAPREPVPFAVFKKTTEFINVLQVASQRTHASAAANFL